MSTDSNAPDSAEISARQTELHEIRTDLRKKYYWLRDGHEDLFRAVAEWMLESYNLPVGSIQGAVQSRLLSLQEKPKHKLRPHLGVDDPEEAFPDACEDCTHYGGKCPIVADKLGRDTLKRHYADAETDEDLLGRLSAMASKHHCVVLKDEIERRQSTYLEHVRRGEKLLLKVNAAVSDMDDDVLDGLDGTGLSVDTDGDGSTGTPGTLPGGDGTPIGAPPDAETAAKVDAITQAVISDDEEDE